MLMTFRMTEGKPYVVVVEDDPLILTLVHDALEMEGFEPIGFNHPFKIETLTVDPALFLFDLMLPDQTGIELAERLREDGYAEAPMIAMSASPVMIEHARQTDLFEAVLTKPFDLDQLLQTVEQLAA